MGYFEPVISDAEYEGWPVIFSICSRHWPLFEDDEHARLSDVESCILCHPVENDSLGG